MYRYKYYNVVSRRLYGMLKRLGCSMVHRLGCGDDQHDFGYEQEFDPWLADLLGGSTPLTNTLLVVHSSFQSSPMSNHGSGSPLRRLCMRSGRGLRVSFWAELRPTDSTSWLQFYGGDVSHLVANQKRLFTSYVSSCQPGIGSTNLEMSARSGPKSTLIL